MEQKLRSKAYLFDKQRLQQVVLNLLSNAIKFQQNGRIIVSQTIFQKDSKTFLKVSVKDKGIGLSNTEISELFKAENLHFRSQFKGGDDVVSNGVGLKICKQICE